MKRKIFNIQSECPVFQLLKASHPITTVHLWGYPRAFSSASWTDPSPLDTLHTPCAPASWPTVSSTGLAPVCPCPSFIGVLHRAGGWMLSGLPSHTCQIKGENHFSHCKTALLRWNPGPPDVTGKKSWAFHPASDSGCHSFCFEFSVSQFLPSFLPLFFFPQHVFTTSSYVIFETSWNINAQSWRINKMVAFKKLTE